MYKKEPTTRDQKLYKIDGQLKAEIDVCLTHETEDAPSIAECRHAVLTIETTSQTGETVSGHVIYDRLLCRIVDGVYYMPLEEVLESTQHHNEDPDALQDMTPNGAALGLKYPKVDKSKNVPILFEDRSNQ